MNLKRQKGLAMVEFAIILPVLLYFLFGVIQYGWLLSKYMGLTNAAQVGVLYLVSQGISTSTPYTNTVASICGQNNGALGVTLCNASYPPGNNSIAIAIALYGTTCNTDATCVALLPPTANCNSSTGTATVTVSYGFTAIVPAKLYPTSSPISSTISASLPTVSC